jgi:hypothetical protein
MNTPAPEQTERQPMYRDQALNKAFRELRATIKTNPAAKLAPGCVEQRLRAVLKVVQSWDDYHAERVELFLRLGDVPEANTAATLLFDSETRTALLARCPIGVDSHDRLEESDQLERTVLA